MTKFGHLFLWTYFVYFCAINNFGILLGDHLICKAKALVLLK